MSNSSYPIIENSPSFPLERSTLQNRNRILGFWLFLASECIIFASLIGTYLALSGQTAGDPGPKEAFDLVFVFIATFVLLTSSLTGVLSTVGLQRGNFRMMHFWLTLTILLGMTFLALQIYEFVHYVSIGLTFSSSAFGSAFYALVGFHGAHVIFGLAWLIALQLQSLNVFAFTRRFALNKQNASKLYIAGLYWHFIDVVWVLIFTLVYLMGKVG